MGLLNKHINSAILQAVVHRMPLHVITAKTEIETDNPTPPEVPESEQPAYITNEQWQDVLNRLSGLETKA